MNRPVPVLYYHRVGAPDPIHLSIPTPLFDAQMAYLARNGWTTLSMRQLIDHVRGVSPAPRKSLAITFDDGFRDNLTEAMPILRKHGLRATVFAVGSLLRHDSAPPAPTHRPFTAAHTEARRGDPGDFLSAAELDKLLEAGIETHSHGWEHAQVFCGSNVTGFYPRTDNHWAIPTAWGVPPDVADVPVFQRKPGLVTNAWVPKQELFRRLFEAGETTLSIGSELESRFFDIETDGQRELRVRDDLSRSKSLFERWHEPDCDAFCWPWGAHDELTRRVAREVGYQGALATSTGANMAGADPFTIHRFPVKKSGLARFVIGLLLRAHPVTSRVYGFLRGRF